MKERDLKPHEIRSLLMERAIRELKQKYPNRRSAFIHGMAKIAVKQWMKTIQGKDTTPATWLDALKAKLPLWAQRWILRPRYRLVPNQSRN